MNKAAARTILIAAVIGTQVAGILQATTTAVALGLAIGLAFFDYYGYNLARNRNNETAMKAYRIIQAVVFLGAGAIAWIREPAAAVALATAWWTWLLDIGYYIFAETGWYTDDEHPDRYPGPGSWDRMKIGAVTWAWWTPAGILLGIRLGLFPDIKGLTVPYKSLRTQAWIGLAIAAGILAAVETWGTR